MYAWKLDLAAFYASKRLPPTPSYVDLGVTLTVPQLVDDHLRLEIRPSFTLDQALPFFGLGNAPVVPATIDPSRDRYQRLHPTVLVNTRWRLSARWFVLAGVETTINQITAAPGSTLVRELAADDPHLTRVHGVVRFETGLAYDSRDNEIAPGAGQWHQLTARASPRLGDVLPYAYQQFNLTARLYTTLVPRTLVLALRGVVDVQTGDVPFYEESRYAETSAIGGGQGVRGVPAYQFYGRGKAFGNAEVRWKVWRTTALGRPFTLGFAGFVDAGRVWELGSTRPAHDGAGVGLHVGGGAGVRLQQGRAFLVRADVAWSPDARPIGVYVMADQAF
jgi:outer membrane protein assembly factor BamA